MSDDERFVSVASAGLALIIWGFWFKNALGITWLGAARGRRTLFALAPLLCFAVLAGILRAFAAHDVRNSPQYLGLYLVLGAAWLGLCTLVLPVTGLSPRDDVVERRNGAVAWTILGALLGITLCYGGGNIGDGPGWGVVVFAAALATGSLLLILLLLAACARLAERITVERDLAVGVRSACVLTACGLVLGRAVAGNWVSAEATLTDFAHSAWPALVPLPVEIVWGRLSRPPGHSSANVFAAGVVPGCAYLLTAGAYVAWQGAW